MSAGFAVSQITGESGGVWLGKATLAGSLTSWVAVPGPGGTWEFAGRLGERDEYLITQAPDALRLPFGETELRWTGVQLEIADDRVTATLPGPPEER